VLLRLAGGEGRVQSYDTEGATPVEGSPEEIAETLRQYAREGIGEVQLVLDPITERSVEALAPVLALLDRE
jgi:alkanesulfonate monooxygenase SsuD/methylene tetrahydromethanopterin reductase-like flavin-dependent oxidoreductase (luciferase family)